MYYHLYKTSIFINFKFHHVYTYLRSTFTNAKFNKSLENQIYRSLLTVILRFYDSHSEYHKKIAYQTYLQLVQKTFARLYSQI